MNITKILLSIIAAIMIVTNTNATTMCVTNDDANIIFDPSIHGTSYTRNEEAKTWTVTFSYGTIKGIATCNSTSGNYARAFPEYNFDNNYASNEGASCWCKMTNPVRSAWVHYSTRDSADNCASHCADYCSYDTMSFPAFRNGMFGSAGM